MRRFAALLDELDGGGDPLPALGRYFAQAPAADAAWALHLLAGGPLRPLLPLARLRPLACAAAGLDDGLFDECLRASGDLAETIALVLPPADAADGAGLAEWLGQRLPSWRELATEPQAAALRAAFDRIDGGGRQLLVKLIGGGFRSPVGRLPLQRALAALAGLESTLVGERLQGWGRAGAAVDASRYAALLAPLAAGDRATGQPYPFGPLQPLRDLAELPLADGRPDGPTGWQLEWHCDGVRVQLVRREGRCWIWTGDGEPIGERLPELVAAAQALPDGTVVEGRLRVWRDGAPAPEPLARLQQRLGRQKASKALQAEAPLVLIATDLLEQGGADIRGRPLHERCSALQDLLALQPGAALRLSRPLDAAGRAALQTLRERARGAGFDGLLLRARQAPHDAGIGWAWAGDPQRVDAVPIYAQAGSGARGGFELTLALWSRRPASAAEAATVVEAIAAGRPPGPGALQLVPFARADTSALGDAGARDVEREIRANALQTFGPVRSLRPTLVIELAFDGLAHSARHRSGLAVRAPRLVRLRPELPLHQASDLPAVQALVTGA